MFSDSKQRNCTKLVDYLAKRTFQHPAAIRPLRLKIAVFLKNSFYLDVYSNEVEDLAILRNDAIGTAIGVTLASEKNDSKRILGKLMSTPVAYADLWKSGFA